MGQECVADSCMAMCESGLRCGDTFECCGAGQLCLSDACVTPGIECTESLECAVGEYCDPSLSRCLPRPDSLCEFFPPAGVFEPTQQWHWSASTTAPDSVHVMMSPVVGDLDGDTLPEVAFVTYTAATSYGSTGVLRVVRGDTGEEVFSVTTPQICGDSGVALGDLDGDGSPEIIVGGPCNTAGRIHAFDNMGTLVWSSTNTDGSPYIYNLDFGAPAIADLEGDGRAEVIVGGTVFEYDGTLRFANRDSGYGCCAAPRSTVTVPYDMDADPQLEIVGANIVWNHDGTVLWEDAALPEGFVAVGDFFEDDQPDVVVVHPGFLSILNGLTGAVIWGPVAQPGGGRGGPPTVADFDGDGLPEIGVAGATAYTVFDPDGDTPILWQAVTQDASSNITGSSVFDFDGDGRAEVVYNDECFMRIYAGDDGTVLAEVPQHSHTLIEYPLIVDVDGDGNTEIVFAANAAVSLCTGIAGYTGNLAGVRVFQDATDNWVGTRRVWNQHAYSVTNIREDLSVPETVTPNWRRLNSFRQNPQSFDAPDLVAAEVGSDASACPLNLTLRATVENRGASPVGPGLSVSFYLGTVAAPGRLVGTATTTTRLVPGASEIVSVMFAPGAGETASAELPFHVVADDIGDGTGTNNECLEDNNAADAMYRCAGIE